MIRGLLIVVFFGCLIRFSGCTSFAAAPQLRTVLPVIAPPRSVTATALYPFTVEVSRELTLPPLPLAMSPTNKIIFPADQQTMFMRGVFTNFPVADHPCVFKWNPVTGAASYRIYVGDAQTNWQQVIETLNKTQLTTKIWKCWPTNTVAMTSINSNGVESVKTKTVVMITPLRLELKLN